MGNQCSIGDKNREQYQLIGQKTEGVFGKIKILKNQRTKQQIAVKQFEFKSSFEIVDYQNKVELAKSYQNIPTLLKIFQYQRIAPLKARVVFEYHHNNLANVLSERREKLRQFSRKNPRCAQQFMNVRMYDYRHIETLPSSVRKYVNFHFHEVEIVRMLDHVIGGVYFLHHFDHHHQAIRPQVILLDQEGKYILPDSLIFNFPKNYQTISNEIENCNLYLAPQIFSNMTGVSNLPYCVQKSDIFSIGLIGLQMAKMETLDNLYNLQTGQLDHTIVSKCLNSIKNKYSSQFVSLLSKMLIIDSDNRINFSQLIDSLNPILSKNINDLQKIYRNEHCDNDIFQQNKCMMLYKKLSELQTQFKQISQLKCQLTELQQYDQKSIIQEENQLVNQLKKLKHLTDNKENKQLKSTQLYEIYLNQYKNMKKLRIK